MRTVEDATMPTLVDKKNVQTIVSEGNLQTIVKETDKQNIIDEEFIKTVTKDTDAQTIVKVQAGGQGDTHPAVLVRADEQKDIDATALVIENSEPKETDPPVLVKPDMSQVAEEKLTVIQPMDVDSQKIIIDPPSSSVKPEGDQKKNTILPLSVTPAQGRLAKKRQRISYCVLA